MSYYYLRKQLREDNSDSDNDMNIGLVKLKEATQTFQTTLFLV